MLPVSEQAWYRGSLQETEEEVVPKGAAEIVQAVLRTNHLTEVVRFRKRGAPSILALAQQE